ncbi:hypothetical protein [Kitasatospora herbaricolor]|uniref:Uncharacterized protein n=1 Tax=Kitasatospora herbaricolor TaxID=68217 RepID=A0ABZ1WKF1_9ACTN|nr:hypothetical protein [Kitasatospora herbaricolor]
MALAVPLGRLRSEAAHFRALPVSSATELRAVAGTALLFALVTPLALAAGVVLRRGATAVTAVVAAVVLPYLCRLRPTVAVACGTTCANVGSRTAFRGVDALRQAR